jgi:signal transduction histidine kinase
MSRDGEGLLNMGNERIPNYTTMINDILGIAPAEVGMIVYDVIRGEDRQVIDWRLREINELALKRLGLSIERLVDQYATEIYSDNPDLSFLIKLSNEVMETGEVRRFEVNWGTPGKRYLMAFFPLNSHTLVHTTIDIAAQTQAEEVLHMVSEDGRVRDEFIALLAHELRNPLASARNSLYIIDHVSPGSEQAKRAMEIIKRQTSRLCRLVEDLLDITCLDKKRVKLRLEPVDLNEIVRQSVEDYSSLFEKKNVHLRIDYASEGLFIDADAARLAQVVEDLLLNVVKFTDSGGSAYISIKKDPINRQGKLTVTDNGIGMTAETITQLFQPFMQAETSLDKNQGGLGLGLALVKSFVEMHGGVVCATSPGLGKGSTFTITLPLRNVVPEKTMVEKVTHNPQRTVLLIEDNIDVADSLKELLEIFGNKVEVAFNGTDGLEKAYLLQPDVLLCDIGLSDMDGYAIAKAFRGNEALKSVYLVAISGYAASEDQRKAIEAGFDRHVAKPPDPTELKRILAELG